MPWKSLGCEFSLEQSQKLKIKYMLLDVERLTRTKLEPGSADAQFLLAVGRALERAPEEYRALLMGVCCRQEKIPWNIDPGTFYHYRKLFYYYIGQSLRSKIEYAPFFYTGEKGT